MNPDSNSPVAASSTATLPTPSTSPVASMTGSTPCVTSTPPAPKAAKPFGHKKAKFAGNAPKL